MPCNESEEKPESQQASLEQDPDGEMHFIEHNLRELLVHLVKSFISDRFKLTGNDSDPREPERTGDK